VRGGEVRDGPADTLSLVHRALAEGDLDDSGMVAGSGGSGEGAAAAEGDDMLQLVDEEVAVGAEEEAPPPPPPADTDGGGGSGGWQVGYGSSRTAPAVGPVVTASGVYVGDLLAGGGGGTNGVGVGVGAPATHLAATRAAGIQRMGVYGAPTTGASQATRLVAASAPMRAAMDTRLWAAADDTPPHRRPR